MLWPSALYLQYQTLGCVPTCRNSNLQSWLLRKHFTESVSALVLHRQKIISPGDNWNSYPKPLKSTFSEFFVSLPTWQRKVLLHSPSQQTFTPCLQNSHGGQKNLYESKWPCFNVFAKRHSSLGSGIFMTCWKHLTFESWHIFPPYRIIRVL